jgi:PadR family transcriptional regulator, regulatory protein PadR
MSSPAVEYRVSAAGPARAEFNRGVFCNLWPTYTVKRYSYAMNTPLTPPVFQILLTLVDADKVHGYSMIREIAERTGGEVQLTASTLYAAIARLLEAGLIDEVDAPEKTGGAPRRCYRITKAGRQLARQEAERLARTVAMARDKRLLPRKA